MPLKNLHPYFCYADSFGGLEQVYCKIHWTISIGPCDIFFWSEAQTCLRIGLHQQPSMNTHFDFDASFPLIRMVLRRAFSLVIRFLSIPWEELTFRSLHSQVKGGNIDNDESSDSPSP